MNSYLMIFAASLAGSILLTWVVRELSKRFGILPEPDRRHHIHSQLIPRLGGVAIFLTFCCFLLLLQLGSGFGFVRSPVGSDPLRILVPAVLLFATGLFDDLNVDFREQDCPGAGSIRRRQVYSKRGKFDILDGPAKLRDKTNPDVHFSNQKSTLMRPLQ